MAGVKPGYTLEGLWVVSVAPLDGNSFPFFGILSKHSKSPNNWHCAIRFVLKGG